MNLKDLFHKTLKCLPARLVMFPHNFVGHPLMAVFTAVGRDDWAAKAHDVTLPPDEMLRFENPPA